MSRYEITEQQINNFKRLIEAQEKQIEASQKSIEIMKSIIQNIKANES